MRSFVLYAKLTQRFETNFGLLSLQFNSGKFPRFLLSGFLIITTSASTTIWHHPCWDRIFGRLFCSPLQRCIQMSTPPQLKKSNGKIKFYFFLGFVLLHVREYFSIWICQNEKKSLKFPSPFVFYSWNFLNHNVLRIFIRKSHQKSFPLENRNKNLTLTIFSHFLGCRRLPANFCLLLFPYAFFFGGGGRIFRLVWNSGGLGWGEYPHVSRRDGAVTASGLPQFEAWYSALY